LVGVVASHDGGLKNVDDLPTIAFMLLPTLEEEPSVLDCAPSGLSQSGMLSTIELNFMLWRGLYEDDDIERKKTRFAHVVFAKRSALKASLSAGH
jgi:hypothetical protein